MSRKSNTAERRQQILDAFLLVLADAGYQGATIMAIAKTAGLTPGLIHYHFKTKQEILLNVVASLVATSNARFQDLNANSQTAEESLFAYIDAKLAKGEGAQPTAVTAWVMIAAEAIRDAEVREVFQTAIRAELLLVTDLIKNCLRESKKRTHAARTLAAGLLSFVEGAFQLASATSDVMPSGYAAGTAKKMITAAMRV